MKITLYYTFLLYMMQHVYYASSTYTPITSCDKENLPFNLKLQVSRPPQQKIQSLKVKAKLEILPSHLTVISYKRHRYSQYCYYGTEIDPNTGCSESITFINASLSDLETWKPHLRCPTGFECEPDGDCWGNTANTRCRSSTITTNLGPEDLKWKGEIYKRFPYHTCVQSWACKVHINNASMQFFSGKTDSDYGVVLPSGEAIVANKQNMENGVDTISGYKVHPIIRGIQRETKEISIHCLGTSTNGIICQPDEREIGLEGSFYLRSQNEPFIVRNFKVTLLSKVKFADHSNFNRAESISDLASFYNLKDKRDLLKSGTIQDAILILNSLHYSQLQSLFNILSTEKEVYELKKAVSTLVTLLAPSYPELIGEILGRPIRTEAMADNTFLIRQCRKSPLVVEGNCIAGLIYESGKFTKNKDKSLCKDKFHVTKNIELFNKTSIDLSIMKEGDLSVSNLENSEWSWVLGESFTKQPLYNEQPKSSEENLIDSIISKIQSPIESIKTWIHSISSLIAWVALFLHIRRR